MAKRPAPTKRDVVRCAIYTRKSTEEGLDQEFNSLNAQREACAAYIVSQRHEGWTPVKEGYDDGGFSGGSMDRPGLRRLLADIAAGKVDVIVVYKVDRLTRALSDFAKIVEILDARGASFVSITQSFNTTTSMGRLTLNVLLSFAQFEREVTGERIRDKIAASKAKGMWMGGTPPLGYDVCERKLIVNEIEAETVRHIMRRYVTLKSARGVIDELHDTDHRTKLYRGRGGLRFRSGGLYHLLNNPTYIGKVSHRGVIHDGEHKPIIDAALWTEVQATLASARVDRGGRPNAPHRSLLVGLIEDSEGRRMTPSHAVKGKRRYRYYVTRGAACGRDEAPVARIAAHALEDMVAARLAAMFRDRAAVTNLMSSIDAARISRALGSANRLADKLDRLSSRYDVVRLLVGRVRLSTDGFTIEVNHAAALTAIGADETKSHGLVGPIILDVHATRIRQHKDVKLIIAGADGSSAGPQNEALVALLAEARQAYDDVIAAPEATIADAARATGRCRKRLAKLVRIAMLAPDIVARCLAGTQPAALTTAKLFQTDLPISWAEQRRALAID